ncbi:MAG: Xaa-Pro peptidase family protein [Pseudomonadota bacterium]
MTALNLHFTEAEFAERRAKAAAMLKERGLDALLMFRQESMYYLTGYDTFGYAFFQCMVLTASGETALITRAPDRRQAQFTSTVEAIRVWVDGPDAEPANELHKLLVDLGLFGKALGIEYDAYGLTGKRTHEIEAALTSFAKLEDASDLVSRLRLIKSDAELAFVRRAAELGDAAWHAGCATTKAGAFEGDILAAMQSAIFSGGGDYPANEFIIGSGPGALMCRYYTGRRHLSGQDQLTLEFGGTYRHYHACLMRTIAVGSAPDRQRELWAAAEDALHACEAELKPGRTAGDVFAAHAKTFDDAGLSECRLNACGYSLGATYAPIWMDWPMLYADNPVELAPGMVFFCHMILFDDATGLAATLGRTSIVTATGAEILSKSSTDLVVV